MNSNFARLLATAAFTLVLVATALPVPHADAMRVCQPPPPVVDAKPGKLPVGTNPLVHYPVWPQGSAWGPYPLDFIVKGGADAGYSQNCFYVQGGPFNGLSSGGQPDLDGDGMGDAWERQWEQLGEFLLPAYDSDHDDLLNYREFQWEMTPVCIPAAGILNCMDFELADGDGDSWTDGAEVAYWNNPNNDALLQGEAVALYDPDRLLDVDGDGHHNTQDTDSDNDTLTDGVEVNVYGTYPEFTDSDCPVTEAACPKSQGGNYYAARPNQPGTGDGLNDSVELAAWNTLGSSAWNTNFDGDSIPDNLLDADSDNDGLLDGEEFLLGAPQVRPDRADTEHDGLLDGKEVAWNLDTDHDGLVNANDPDSDNDGMPDAWEVQNSLNMVDATDAGLDVDGDLLSNLQEFHASTNPNNMDTEGDLLLDGAEVLNWTTNPLFWDTDHDGMADRFETDNGLRPLDPTDASQDPDGDSFDRDGNGVPELAYPNLAEYRYGRAADYNEVGSGPWLLGTKPKNPDTDSDTAPDGYEVYYGQDPRLPADVNSDQDQDGLSWGEEVQMGSDPNDADTDNDGLCDGGHAAMCFKPKTTTPGFQVGEADYGSVAWNADSDRDLLPDWSEALRNDPGATGHDNDTDADGLGSIIDADSDNDGVPDGAEVLTYHTNDQLADTDHDQANDGVEVARLAFGPYDVRFSDPLKSDTDGDGLLDGPEIDVHRTSPNWPDSDGDLLHDGQEIQAGTSPLNPDSDQDGMDDYREYLTGTNPTVADADKDVDNDGLTNSQELVDSVHYFWTWTSPLSSDTDGDGMSDQWEWLNGKWKYPYSTDLNPTRSDASHDADGDGLTNLQEFNLHTSPIFTDSDGDGLGDGLEVNVYDSYPTMQDSDGDGLLDSHACARYSRELHCGEMQMWSNHQGSPGFSYGPDYVTRDYDKDGQRFLKDMDSDEDGLDDRAEFALWTDPTVQDTDHDTLSDFQEVVVFGGRFDPHKADTDGDGIRDDEEARGPDPTSDWDHDGLTTAQEAYYGTDSNNFDTDCDGVEDGPEATYWGADWATGGNRLRNNDTDGDTLLDGVEIGTVGTPSQVLYVTDPAVADTDQDGLTEDREARNNVYVQCAPGTSQSTSISLAPGLLPDGLMQGPQGLEYGVDDVGVYIRGGFGVHLYVGADGAAVNLADLLAGDRMAQPGPNGLTNPMKWDTDGDGISDGQEVSGNVPGRPPGPTPPSDPTACDSDGDGLGDMLEMGIAGQTANPGDPCTHRDSNPYNKPTDPKKADSDADGFLDGQEDKNKDGDLDISWLGSGYCGMAGETDAADADTDDDGIGDFDETSGKLGAVTTPYCFDSDLDGLSDGLEQGVATKLSDTGIRTVLGFLQTWQPWQGRTLGGVKLTTLVNNPDSDKDGILDGLEDANHNGRWGFDGYFHDTANFGGSQMEELNPSVMDGNQDGKPDGQDSDGDGIFDGRELLIAGTYRFQDVMSSWGNSFQGMVFQAANPYQTDPRSANTDGTGPLDGNDLNPRADALLAIEFGEMMFTEDDQNEELGDYYELYVNQLTIDLPVTSGDYTVQVPDSDSTMVPKNVKVWQIFPSDQIDKLTDVTHRTAPTAAELVWKINRIDSSPALKINFPDDATQLNPGDLKVKVTIDLREDDPANNDILDVNGDLAETKLVYEINLAGDAPDAPLNGAFPGQDLSYLQWRDAQLPVFSGDPRHNDGDEDFNLEFHGGDSIPRTFLSRFAPGLVPDPLAGKTCFGSASCLA